MFVGKDCGTPLQLANGYIPSFVSNTTFEAVVEYVCNRGYNMVGRNQSRCGELGTWSTLPLCHSK